MGPLRRQRKSIIQHERDRTKLKLAGIVDNLPVFMRNEFNRFLISTATNANIIRVLQHSGMFLLEVYGLAYIIIFCCSCLFVCLFVFSFFLLVH